MFGVIYVVYCNFDDVVCDVEIVFDVMGDDYVGFGSDYYGVDLVFEGFEYIGKLLVFIEEFFCCGYSDEMVCKFLGENYLRVFEQIWGV